MKIHFMPQHKINKPHYWGIHAEYFLETFKAAGYSVHFNEQLNLDFGIEVLYEGKLALFDFNDLPTRRDYNDKYHAIFKTHVHELHDKRLHPWFPISFYNWQEFYAMQEKIQFSAKGRILNNQQLRKNSIQRRSLVQRQLLRNYGATVDIELTSPQRWWNKFNSCLCYVHVPGETNNMIDRGTAQAMFFGVCVITPQMPELLPYGKRFVENEHYIVVKNDYSDLIEKIEWCKGNKEKCLEIGNAAKELCLNNFTAKHLVQWFESKMGGDK